MQTDLQRKKCKYNAFRMMGFVNVFVRRGAASLVEEMSL